MIISHYDSAVFRDLAKSLSKLILKSKRLCGPSGITQGLPSIGMLPLP